MGWTVLRPREAAAVTGGRILGFQDGQGREGGREGDKMGFRAACPFPRGLIDSTFLSPSLGSVSSSSAAGMISPVPLLLLT